ncbi:hypothetical protein R5W23_005126 [Gemmata sp. JC673]|uniref:Uncharacterized protein n=1 Tax=Gemmata algarum TaxID=2975278 RepID=A0ABU5F7Q3_9BACT|nr:hypothetical protein [Gemmata algarum]MDY3563514.1 hypothetical protein [Gemmata algarum]
MSATPARARHSGFARFPSAPNRDRFVRTVLAPDPDLTNRAYVSGSQPTIVFEQLTADERDRIIQALVGLGNWFEDTQFRPTATGG